MALILLRVAAWLSVLVICVLTLGPIGLRPVSSASVDIERSAAFLVVGSLFGAAYPKKVLLTALLMVAFPGVLEFGQNFVADRHGLFSDFVVKAAAGTIGVLAGRLAAQALEAAIPGRTRTATNLTRSRSQWRR
jgi:hypothetical protein